MGNHNPTDSCLICRRTTLDSLSGEPRRLLSNPALLQEFLNCFHINNILDSQLNDLSTSCQFCLTCQRFLAEWGSIQTQMAQLTRRATQLKFTLSALLLSAPGIQNHYGDVTQITESRIQNSHGLDLPLLLQQTVDEIRNELRKQYSVNVVLDRMHMPRLPRSKPKVEHEFDPLAGHSDNDNDDEPMDDWRGDDNNSDVEYFPSEIVEMRMTTAEETSSDDSSERDPLDLEEVNVTRKEKPRQTKARKRSRTEGKSVRRGKPKEQHAAVIPDGPNRFKYHGHSLTLNLADQCYYCGACDHKGSTVLTGILLHIRGIHFTEEDKRKFSAVKTSDTEWVYGGEFKIVAVGQKFMCVTCGCMNSRLLRLTWHIQSKHVDLGGPDDGGVPLPVTDTPSVNDSTPIQGEFQGVPYTMIPADDEYTCGICQSQVGSRACFLIHVKERHTTEKQKQRPKPSKFVFIPDGPNAFKYNGHSFRLNDQDECYYCSACDFKGNTSVNGILKHIRELHYSEEDKVKFTAVKISDTEWLYGGKFKIIRAGERFKCVWCGHVASRLNELYVHIRNKHVGMEDDPPVAVPLPVTDTPSVSELTPTQGVYKSVPYTFNPVDHKFTCGMCQVQLSSRKSLESHVLQQHTAQVRIICEICGKESASKRGHQEHFRRHQADPKSCPTCNKKFYCPKAFSTHLKIHILGDAAKKHQCEYCGKRFVSIDNYKNHVPIHTGEMPYECHVCGRKFRYATDLSHHRITAHGVKPQARKLMRINE